MLDWINKQIEMHRVVRPEGNAIFTAYPKGYHAGYMDALMAMREKLMRMESESEMSVRP